MTIKEEIEKIEREAADEMLWHMLWQMDMEMKIVRGEIPMPEVPPLRCPFIYKDKS